MKMRYRVLYRPALAATWWHKGRSGYFVARGDMCGYVMEEAGETRDEVVIALLQRAARFSENAGLIEMGEIEI